MIIGKKYSFNTVNSTFIASRYEDVELISNTKLKGITDRSLSESTYVKYRQLFPILTTSYPVIPSNPDDSNFYVFITNDKQYIVLSEFWIDLTTLEESNNVPVTFTVYGCSEATKEAIRRYMIGIGITQLTIK